MNQSTKEHPAEAVFKKFMLKKNSKSIMSKLGLLKTITQTYTDLLEMYRQGQQIPQLLCYVYDSLMTKYGFKKLGLEKYKQLMGTVIKLSKESGRVQMFGRLFTLLKNPLNSSAS